MATVYAPIAKDESINTTESPSRNIADVLAQGLSGIENAITGGSDKAPKTDIATVEPSNTASRAYSVGELVYVNGNLYKVITAIVGGATFTVGTNIQSTNVSDAIARPHFKNRQLLATFNVNGAIWTPNSDGFITIMLRDAVSTIQYAYVKPGSSSADPICTVTCLSGPQGATFTNTAPVQKGQTYYLQTNVSDVPIYFTPFDV